MKSVERVDFGSTYHNAMDFCGKVKTGYQPTGQLPFSRRKANARS